MSASGLHACEAIDAGGDIAIVSRIGLQFEEHCQSPGRLAGAIEQHAEIVQHLSTFVGRRRRSFGGALEPFDGQRLLAAPLIHAAERCRSFEALPGRTDGGLQ